MRVEKISPKLISITTVWGSRGVSFPDLHEQCSYDWLCAHNQCNLKKHQLPQELMMPGIIVEKLPQGPTLVTWISFNPTTGKLLHKLNISDEIIYLYPKTTSSHNLLGMWLLLHGGVKVKSCKK